MLVASDSEIAKPPSMLVPSLLAALVANKVSSPPELNAVIPVSAAVLIAATTAATVAVLNVIVVPLILTVLEPEVNVNVGFDVDAWAAGSEFCHAVDPTCTQVLFNDPATEVAL